MGQAWQNRQPKMPTNQRYIDFPTRTMERVLFVTYALQALELLHITYFACGAEERRNLMELAIFTEIADKHTGDIVHTNTLLFFVVMCFRRLAGSVAGKRLDTEIAQPPENLGLSAVRMRIRADVDLHDVRPGSP